MERYGSAMSAEMLLCAENIYRRFPEEFLALGKPGLEASFDLHTDGRQGHRVMDTAGERAIEVMMRRWPSPMAESHGLQPQHYSLARPQLHSVGGALSCCGGSYGGACARRHVAPFVSWHGAGGFGPCSAPGALPLPPAAPAAMHEAVASATAAAAEDLVTARLMRLEEALATLKPQVEMVLYQQVSFMASAAAATAATSSAPATWASWAAPATSAAPTSLGGDVPRDAAPPPKQASPCPEAVAARALTATSPVLSDEDIFAVGQVNGNTSPLRVRRGRPQLTVMAPKKPTKGAATPTDAAAGNEEAS